MNISKPLIARLSAVPRLAMGALTIALLFPAAAPQAARVKALAIDTMTERAGIIFSGRCIDARTVQDKTAGRPVAELKFEVLRWVKGLKAKRQITVRMLAAGSLAGFPAGPAGEIRPGDEVVLFLYPESKLGLTSPVGLGQGRFAVLPDRKGGRLAINPWSNTTLLQDVAEPTLSRFSLEARLELESGRVRPETLLDVAELLSRETEPTDPSTRIAEPGR